ncbi:MAG: FAD-dependent oxidoreductase, partial [Vallitaleaceae bacterium]|nr:FAD-dependent oxidoreductase [Vallitaleaceae bacterium]
CDYETVSSYVYSTTKKGKEDLLKELEAAEKLNLPASIEENLELPFKAESALCFTNQGMFHPRKYILGMVEALINQGVSIYEHTRICEVLTEGGFELKTTEGLVIRAKKVVLATKYPILNKKGLYFAKLHIERSYGLAVISSKIKLSGLYLNAEKPVRSLRPYKSGEDEWTIIVGANHPTGENKDTEKCYEELISFAKEMDPHVKIAYRWSTQDCMSPDSIPYIGEHSEDLPGVFVATGFSKWGMTHSTVAAMLLSDTILGINNPWKEIYNPGRSISLGAVKELVTQGIETAGDLLHKILPVKAASLNEILKGEGQVIENDGQLTGVYKDETGKVHLVKPTCKHMGCRLTFNTAEKSWDCPCHGSRYTYEGQVIEAPAVLPLDLLESDE